MINIFKSYLSNMMLISLFLVLFSIQSYSQSRVNVELPNIEKIKKIANLSQFEYWKYDSNNGQWENYKNRVNRITRAPEGLTLYRFESQGMTFIALTAKSDKQIQVYLFNDYNFIEGLSDEQLSLICVTQKLLLTNENSSSEIEPLREEISKKLFEFKYRDYNLCQTYFPLYRTNNGDYRFDFVQNIKAIDLGYYTRKFSQGPYIEVKQSIFDEFYSQSIQTLFNVDSLIKAKPNKTTLDRHDKIKLASADNFSPIIKNMSSSSDMVLFFGNQVNVTEQFNLYRSESTLKWNNESGSILIKIQDRLGKDLELLVKSNKKSGQIILPYNANKYSLYVESDGQWDIEITTN